MFSNFRMKKIIVVILTAPKVALKTEAFVMSQTFVHVRWGILDIRVPTVSDFQDVCMELALKALNAIAIQDGKESTAIFVSSTNKIFQQNKSVHIILLRLFILHQNKFRLQIHSNTCSQFPRT